MYLGPPYIALVIAVDLTATMITSGAIAGLLIASGSLIGIAIACAAIRGPILFGVAISSTLASNLPYVKEK